MSHRVGQGNNRGQRSNESSVDDKQADVGNNGGLLVDKEKTGIQIIQSNEEISFGAKAASSQG